MSAEAKMVDLKRVPTIDLIQEIVRRASINEEWARRAAKPERYCDDCRHIRYGKRDGDKARCYIGYAMKFRVPDDYGEANRGDYGYYRLDCRDFEATDGGRA